jgi:hypothetical protein
MFKKNLENFPELKEIGKWLKDNNNSFLSSIYHNAHKWELSDNQINAAKRSFEKILNTKYIEFNDKQIKLWKKIIEKYLPQPNYYNNSTFNYDMLDLIISNKKLTQGQYSTLYGKILKYRKSIIKKIFKEL